MNGIISCCYYVQCLKYLMLLNAYDAHRSHLTPSSNLAASGLAFRSHFPKRFAPG